MIAAGGRRTAGHRIRRTGRLVRRPPGHPGVLGDFHRAHPAVTLQLTVSPSGSGGLVAGLTEGRLDLAILPRFAVPADLGVVLRTVSDADLQWPLGVATSAVRAPSAATRALLALIDTAVVPSGAGRAPPGRT